MKSTVHISYLHNIIRKNKLTLNCSVSLRWGCKMSKLTWPMSKHSLNVPGKWIGIFGMDRHPPFTFHLKHSHHFVLYNEIFCCLLLTCIEVQRVKARVCKSRNKIAIYRSLALLLANIETNGQYVSSENEIFSSLPSARMISISLLKVKVYDIYNTLKIFSK